MSQFDQVLGDEYNLEVASQEGRPAFFQHIEGEYKGMVGITEPRYIDVEKKTCEKTKPGATLANYTTPIFIIGSPDGHGLAPDFSIPEKVQYGSLVLNQWVEVNDKERQFQNFNLFKDFTLNNDPETSVIENLDHIIKGKYAVRFDRLKYYIGAPISFILTRGKENKAKNPYVTEVKLLNKILTPEVFKNRVEHVKALTAKIKALREQEEASKSSSNEVPPPNVPAANSIMNEYE